MAPTNLRANQVSRVAFTLFPLFTVIRILSRPRPNSLTGFNGIDTWEILSHDPACLQSPQLAEIVISHLTKCPNLRRPDLPILHVTPTSSQTELISPLFHPKGLTELYVGSRDYGYGIEILLASFVSLRKKFTSGSCGNHIVWLGSLLHLETPSYPNYDLDDLYLSTMRIHAYHAWAIDTSFPRLKRLVIKAEKGYHEGVLVRIRFT